MKLSLFEHFWILYFFQYFSPITFSGNFWKPNKRIQSQHEFLRLAYPILFFGQKCYNHIRTFKANFEWICSKMVHFHTFSKIRNLFLWKFLSNSVESHQFFKTWRALTYTVKSCSPVYIYLERRSEREKDCKKTTPNSFAEAESKAKHVLTIYNLALCRLQSRLPHVYHGHWAT